jgi:hypothetical protein
LKPGKHRSPRPRRDGCGFLTLTCVFTCFFLILNSALVARFYPELADLGPNWLQHPRIEQMMKFVAPVLLIFVQWWVVDLAADFFAPAGHVRQSDPDPDSKPNAPPRTERN